MKPLSTPLSSRLDSRLAAYAAVATAALAAPALPNAEAAIVSSGPVNITIPSSTAGIYLNVVTGAFGGSSTAGWDVNPFGATSTGNPGGVLNMFITSTMSTNLGGGAYVGSGTNWFNLTLGTLVSGASTFGGANVSVAASTPLNLNSANNFVGFRFRNEQTGAINFGWMQIALLGTPSAQPRAIVQYAYENTGAGIQVGAVPEPSTYALFGVMAIGALGMRAWRKRQAA